ncbi:DivIVA domain-containing protein [Glycomyces buryatensis]|uniref:DivIVA domain-containing protein n=1 Tax=Glycomyces buryatensis TaxID=2570927 RepID=A0A4S8QJ99_9ACTN|nr:DivIVA domain-containing protein [Glycomyces buryatensis]THV43085.1 DivIVA domain-containing protein [Glycomyces buryatensis]
MENPFFSVRFRGYDRAQVDRAISRIRRAVDSGAPPHPDSLTNLGFQLTMRGYDPGEVDEYFEEVARTIRGG